MEWARRNHSEKPAVIGAVIQLGSCFDLLDSKSTDILHRYYQAYEKSKLSRGTLIPVNQKRNKSDPDYLKRELDCDALNFTLGTLELEDSHYDSVRGVFQEGQQAFPGGGIHLRSHIQIAVRNKSCILGYFNPVLTYDR